jgi:hypothetical protein
MSETFWARASSRAFSDSRRFLGIDTRDRLMKRLALAVLVVAALYFFGSPDSASDEFKVRLFVISIVVLCFPFVFAWRLIGEPARMELETLQNVSKARDFFEQIRKKEEIQVELISICKEAIKIAKTYNGDVFDEYEKKAKTLNKKIDIFSKDNLNAYDGFSLEGDQDYFFDKKRWPNVYTIDDDDFNTEIQKLTLRIAPMERLMASVVPYDDAMAKGLEALLSTESTVGKTNGLLPKK